MSLQHHRRSWVQNFPRITCLQLLSLSPSTLIVYEDYGLYKTQSLSKNSELLWWQIQSGPQPSRLYTPVNKSSEKSFPIPNNWEILLYFRQWFDNRVMRKRLDWRNLHTLFWYPVRQQSLTHGLTSLLRYVFANVSYVLSKNQSPIWRRPLFPYRSCKATSSYGCLRKPIKPFRLFQRDFEHFLRVTNQWLLSL